MELRFPRWALLFGLLGILAILGIFAPTGSNLFAQDAESADRSADSSEHVTLVRTYNIRKIYSHRLGYRIDVMNYGGQVRTIYAKIAWFVDPTLRNPELDTFEVAASMNYMSTAANRTSNYLTLRYEGGKMRSLVIYVDKPDRTKYSIWSPVPATEDIDSKFDIETVIFSDPPVVTQSTPKSATPDKAQDAEAQDTENQGTENQGTENQGTENQDTEVQDTEVQDTEAETQEAETQN
ncbi:hypothetical protein P0082_08470 [Candidatus Haliotispira prima]|uniref:DUF4833 domain-containing protein n=1 Tax=Candidatus Haliotispira prima TaxID=3034016 RepID=A0ABY8MEV3_9SPIO|nr:hypothetical protein P0082_08470 [Candidatus Haliotispira prima]